ncbi:hypothetical protein Y032_0283g1316 [Ancylostoma ceylanicum]|uniref:Integrase catalytic domain-containing protein n=1 Tax=Ancylostoma ceylanicum TaxID=53326 RepID=A0A016S6E8_9BILA|nr:hypothetical protein Y032_0283g1316 [Ancylostoma ceylanicum]
MTSVIESERFSKWSYILRTVVMILTFITRLSPKATQHFGATKTALRSRAEVILFRMAQIEDPPCSDLQRHLTLFKCRRTNLFRVRTRIRGSALPLETKEPILLPRKSNITELFILYIHERNHHCGTEQTLIELRKWVWVQKGRSTVKRVINNRCFLCKRTNLKPFKLPDFPPHPDYRVNTPNFPFENCGLDVMGPMKYKSKHEESKKCWNQLTTCLNCRAIVVNIIRSLSSHTILHSLRRFIALNGCPKRIICDNAPAFKAFAQTQSDEPMNEENSKDLLDYCATNKIQFKFIPAFSPWQGGVYERMIGIFKSAFTQATRNRTLLIDDLHTLAKESEAVCNSRPLTYVNEQKDFIPLRPINFIRPTARLTSPCLLNEDDEWKPQYTTRDNLIKDWRFGLKLLETFWKRWQAEYLTCLREQHQISHPYPRIHNTDKPTHGEYVLIHDDNNQRGSWRMGQICGSSDGYQRSVQVRLPSGLIITRPINLVSRSEITPNTTN